MEKKGSGCTQGAVRRPQPRTRTPAAGADGGGEVETGLSSKTRSLPSIILRSAYSSAAASSAASAAAGSDRPLHAAPLECR